jgi:hypothetical protein
VLRPVSTLPVVRNWVPPSRARTITTPLPRFPRWDAQSEFAARKDWIRRYTTAGNTTAPPTRASLTLDSWTEIPRTRARRGTVHTVQWTALGRFHIWNVENKDSSGGDLETRWLRRVQSREGSSCMRDLMFEWDIFIDRSNCIPLRGGWITVGVGGAPRSLRVLHGVR